MARGRHFHTFDALRFLAFFKVFLYHAPIAGFAALDYVRAGGTFAVRFFFVLSGFLITYLILTEKEQTGRLAFKYFIVRRMLRIWPLYYLIVAFAFCTPYILSALNLGYSNDGYEPNFLLTIAFAENYVAILKHDAPNVSPLGVIWSVCVEEHFYIVWGLALWGLHRRHVPKLIAFSVALAIVSRSVFVASGYETLDLLTNIDYFAMGAIPAYLLTVQGERVAAWVDSIPLWFKRCYVVLVIGVVLVAPHVPGDLVKVLGPCVLGLFFGGLLMLLLSTRSSFGISDRNILSRLGKYTLRTLPVSRHHPYLDRKDLRTWRVERSGFCRRRSDHAVGLERVRRSERRVVPLVRTTIPRVEALRVTGGHSTRHVSRGDTRC